MRQIIELLNIEPSRRKDKKLVATFKVDDRIRHIHFGLKNSLTYAEGADDKTRDAYIARHSVNEDWTNPLTAGALSYWVLWHSNSIDKGIKIFKNLFKL